MANGGQGQKFFVDSTQANGTTKSTLTQLAAHRLEEIRAHELRPDVQEKATACLLDYLGALITGLSAPWSGALLSYARKASPVSAEAHVMGSRTLAAAGTAAFTNACIAHSIIRDDIHLSAGAHIGVMVIPAALALAQRENWSGKTLLKSIVGGYEMAAALGSAVRSSGTCNPHFRPSGIIGAFAAAAAGVVADANISSDAAASALSLAANMAAGLNEWPWAGGMEINTQMGTASRSGITSLDLARAGIRSSETILEGKDGLFVAYGCGPDSSKHFQEWMSASSLGAGIMGAKFKPTAGCNFIQTPLSAALGLSAKISPAVEDVERIVIITTTAAQAYPGCDNLGPFSQVQQTKMSLQYGVSAALLFGRVDEPVFRQFENEALGMLIRKCHIEPSAAYDEALSNGKQPCRIEVIMRDGSRHENSLADVPWLEGDAVEQRFRQEAAATFDFETVSRIVSECQQLQGSTTCASLFSLLRS